MDVKINGLRRQLRKSLILIEVRKLLPLFLTSLSTAPCSRKKVSPAPLLLLIRNETFVFRTRPVDRRPYAEPQWAVRSRRKKRHCLAGRRRLAAKTPHPIPNRTIVEGSGTDARRKPAVADTSSGELAPKNEDGRNESSSNHVPPRLTRRSLKIPSVHWNTLPD